MELKDKPSSHFSAHADLIYVVYDDKSTDAVNYPNYKYVADIYVNGIMVTRIKKTPNPSNSFGIFNVADVVRGYLQTSFSPQSSFLAQSLGTGEYYTSIKVKFGEEYDFTIYTNLLASPEQFVFNHYNGRLFGTRTALESGKFVTNRPAGNYTMVSGGRSFIPYFPDSDSTVLEIKTYDNALIGTQNITKTASKTIPSVTLDWAVVGDGPVDINLFVNHNGTDIVQQYTAGEGDFSLDRGESITVRLTALSGFPWPTPAYGYLKITADGEEIFYKEISSHGSVDETLAEVSFAIENKDYVITAFSAEEEAPGNPDIDRSTMVIEPTPFDLQIIDVSPDGINSETPGFIGSNVKYYTVRVNTQTFRFDIECEPRYTPYTLHFMNQYGGFESFDFRKVSRQNITIQKESFGKLPYTVNENGEVMYQNSNGVYNEQTSVYSAQWTEPWTLNSDLLRDEEYRWLAELLTSPMVFIELDGYYYPVQVKSSDYEVRKQRNDSLTNLTLEIEFGETFNAQYR